MKRSVTSLRTKLTVLLAVPLAVLVIVAGLGVGAAAGAKRQADDAAEGLRLVVAADDAALALIQERRLSTTSPGDDALEAQRSQTDEAVDVLTSQLSSQGHRLDTQHVDVSAATEALDNLSDPRALVDGDKDGADSPSDDVLRSYSQIIDPVLALDQGFHDSTDAEVFGALQAHRAAVRAIDSVALQESLLKAVFEEGTLTPAIHSELTDIVASENLWIERFHETASSFQRAGYSQLPSAPSVTNAERLRDGVLATGPDVPIEANAAMWVTAMDKKADLLVALAADSAVSLDGALNSQRQAAGQGVLRSIALLFGALGTSALLVYALHRLAIQPIERLGTETQEAAAEAKQAADSGELGHDPYAILPVSGVADDELSDVVDAFNTMQDTVVSLSTERSAMRDQIQDVFLHFGRRAQNLVTRQLGQIDDLETRTDDPDMLSDLFVLDHVATRLRRNAESLVVLAGSESPRPWARPVSVVNVVRAAAAEAIDYSRVDVVHMASAAVTGSKANDVSHLLAELIDNALTYSPPEARVAIAGERHPDGRYLVVISDAGLGMSPRQLEEANARLTGSPGDRFEGDEPVSKYFGLYVVSQLAKRHRIAVRLVPSHLNGIRAEVALPRSVMVLPTDAQAPAIQGTMQTGETRLPPPAPVPRPPVARPPTPEPPVVRAPIAMPARGWQDVQS